MPLADTSVKYSYLFISAGNGILGLISDYTDVEFIVIYTPKSIFPMPLPPPPQKHGVAQAQEAIQRSGLTQLLVRKCSKGTGFSKMWLLRDLEILSIMLYSSKHEIHSMAEDTDAEADREEGEEEEEEGEDEREEGGGGKGRDSDHSSCCGDENESGRPDPLEGLDEETKICFQVEAAI